MADRSAYMGPGGYTTGGAGGTAGGTSGGGGYAREEYAFNMTDNAGGGQSGGSSGTPGVTKPRTDVSAYLGPS